MHLKTKVLKYIDRFPIEELIKSHSTNMATFVVQRKPVTIVVTAFTTTIVQMFHLILDQFISH